MGIQLRIQLRSCAANFLSTASAAKAMSCAAVPVVPQLRPGLHPYGLYTHVYALCRVYIWHRSSKINVMHIQVMTIWWVKWPGQPSFFGKKQQLENEVYKKYQNILFRLRNSSYRGSSPAWLISQPRGTFHAPFGSLPWTLGCRNCSHFADCCHCCHQNMPHLPWGP